MQSRNFDSTSSLYTMLEKWRPLNVFVVVVTKRLKQNLALSIAELREAAHGAPWVTKYGNAWMSENLVMTSLPSVRNLKMLMRPCLFGGKLHRQLRLRKTKRKFEDSKCRVNLCDQQLKKQQDDQQWKKQIDCLNRRHIVSIFTNLEVKSFYSEPARRNVGFLLLRWNFSRCKNEGKNQQWNKRTGYSPDMRVFMWFCFLFCDFVLLFRCFACSVDTPFTYLQSGLLSPVFRSMFIISLGVLFPNLLPSCFNLILS